MKMRVAPGRREVREIAGHQVVDADHLKTLEKKPIDEVGAEKPRRARDERRPP
jgi:hypothetical protein